MKLALEERDGIVVGEMWVIYEAKRSLLEGIQDLEGSGRRSPSTRPYIFFTAFSDFVQVFSAN